MSTLVKLEKNLCRCCHEEGYFINLASPLKHTIEDVDKLTYSEVLKFCFDIQMEPVEDASSDVTYTICPECVESLRISFQFKKQVLYCEERFNSMLDQGGLMQISEVEVPVKDEKDNESDDDYFNDVAFNQTADNGDTCIVSSDTDDLLIPVSGTSKTATETVKKTKKPPAKRGKYKKKPKSDAPKPAGSNETNESQDGQEKKDEEQPKNTIFRFRVPYADFKQCKNYFLCNRCQAKFNKMATLHKHVKEKHYNLKTYYNCRYCSVKLKYASARTKHEFEEHKVDNRFKCNACEDQAFNKKMSLENHLKVYHMMGEKLKCKTCDFETYSKMNLDRHEANHKLIKNFKCKFCSKSFKRKCTLAFHERIHTGDKRKVCKICSQAFVQKASLNYHMTKHHPEVPF